MEIVTGVDGSSDSRSSSEEVGGLREGGRGGSVVRRERERE